MLISSFFKIFNVKINANLEYFVCSAKSDWEKLSKKHYEFIFFFPPWLSVYHYLIFQLFKTSNPKNNFTSRLFILQVKMFEKKSLWLNFMKNAAFKNFLINDRFTFKVVQNYFLTTFFTFFYYKKKALYLWKFSTDL